MSDMTAGMAVTLLILFSFGVPLLLDIIVFHDFSWIQLPNWTLQKIRTLLYFLVPGSLLYLYTTTFGYGFAILRSLLIRLLGGYGRVDEEEEIHRALRKDYKNNTRLMEEYHEASKKAHGQIVLMIEEAKKKDEKAAKAEKEILQLTTDLVQKNSKIGSLKDTLQALEYHKDQDEKLHLTFRDQHVALRGRFEERADQINKLREQVKSLESLYRYELEKLTDKLNKAHSEDIARTIQDITSKHKLILNSLKNRNQADVHRFDKQSQRLKDEIDRLRNEAKDLDTLQISSKASLDTEQRSRELERQQHQEAIKTLQFDKDSLATQLLARSEAFNAQLFATEGLRDEVAALKTKNKSLQDDKHKAYTGYAELEAEIVSLEADNIQLLGDVKELATLRDKLTQDKLDLEDEHTASMLENMEMMQLQIDEAKQKHADYVRFCTLNHIKKPDSIDQNSSEMEDDDSGTGTSGESSGSSSSRPASSGNSSSNQEAAKSESAQTSEQENGEKKDTNSTSTTSITKQIVDSQTVGKQSQAVVGPILLNFVLTASRFTARAASEIIVRAASPEEEKIFCKVSPGVQPISEIVRSGRSALEEKKQKTLIHSVADEQQADAAANSSAAGKNQADVVELSAVEKQVNVDASSVADKKQANVAHVSSVADGDQDDVADVSSVVDERQANIANVSSVFDGKQADLAAISPALDKNQLNVVEVSSAAHGKQATVADVSSKAVEASDSKLVSDFGTQVKALREALASELNVLIKSGFHSSKGATLKAGKSGPSAGILKVQTIRGVKPRVSQPKDSLKKPSNKSAKDSEKTNIRKSVKIEVAVPSVTTTLTVKDLLPGLDSLSLAETDRPTDIITGKKLDPANLTPPTSPDQPKPSQFDLFIAQIRPLTPPDSTNDLRFSDLSGTRSAQSIPYITITPPQEDVKYDSDEIRSSKLEPGMGESDDEDSRSSSRRRSPCQSPLPVVQKPSVLPKTAEIVPTVSSNSERTSTAEPGMVASVFDKAGPSSDRSAAPVSKVAPTEMKLPAHSQKSDQKGSESINVNQSSTAADASIHTKNNEEELPDLSRLSIGSSESDEEDMPLPGIPGLFPEAASQQAEGNAEQQPDGDGNIEMREAAALETTELDIEQQADGDGNIEMAEADTLETTEFDAEQKADGDGNIEMPEADALEVAEVESAASMEGVRSFASLSIDNAQLIQQGPGAPYAVEHSQATGHQINSQGQYLQPGESDHDPDEIIIDDKELLDDADAETTSTAPYVPEIEMVDDTVETTMPVVQLSPAPEVEMVTDTVTTMMPAVSRPPAPLIAMHGVAVDTSVIAPLLAGLQMQPQNTVGHAREKPNGLSFGLPGFGLPGYEKSQQFPGREYGSSNRTTQSFQFSGPDNAPCPKQPVPSQGSMSALEFANGSLAQAIAAAKSSGVAQSQGPKLPGSNGAYSNSRPVVQSPGIKHSGDNRGGTRAVGAMLNRMSLSGTTAVEKQALVQDPAPIQMVTPVQALSAVQSAVPAQAVASQADVVRTETIAAAQENASAQNVASGHGTETNAASVPSPEHSSATPARSQDTPAPSVDQNRNATPPSTRAKRSREDDDECDYEADTEGYGSDKPAPRRLIFKKPRSKKRMIKKPAVKTDAEEAIEYDRDSFNASFGSVNVADITTVAATSSSPPAELNGEHVRLAGAIESAYVSMNASVASENMAEATSASATSSSSPAETTDEKVCLTEEQISDLTHPQQESDEEPEAASSSGTLSISATLRREENGDFGPRYCSINEQDCLEYMTNMGF